MVGKTAEVEKKKTEEVKKDAAKGGTDKKDKDKDKKEEELSEEDKQLQEELNMLMERLEESDTTLYTPAMETMRNLIRASTTSMTSVPKPLKFMKPHMDRMKKIHANMAAGENKKFCADILSALSMTTENSRDCLKYRLLGQKEPIGDWGHEYVRHLCTEAAEEWKILMDVDYKELTKSEVEDKKKAIEILTNDLVAHCIKHNAEAEACDLLMEIEKVHLLVNFVTIDDYARVCLYLLACVPYVTCQAPDPENILILKAVKSIYDKFEKRIESLRCALMMNNMEMIDDCFFKCPDKLEQFQMALILGRHQIFLDLDDFDDDHGDTLRELNSNAKLFQYFQALARELDIKDPKSPEDIYKSHLEPNKPITAGSSKIETAKENLAATFVSGFVNTGFGTDKLLKIGDQDTMNQWFNKNKDWGIFSAAASQGLVLRWDMDGGLSSCDKFLYHNDEYIKGGTMLAIGIVSSGIHHDCDPAQALLLDYVSAQKAEQRIGSILGLGIAYANSKQSSVVEEVIPKLLSVFSDDKSSNEVIGITAISLGLICVATGNKHADVVTSLVTIMMEKQAQLNTDHNLKFLALGMALIFLGKQDDADVIIETVQTLGSPYRDMAKTLLEVCAYTGTGNVLKIQELMHICSEHYDTGKDEKKEEKKEKKDDKDKKEEEKPADLSMQQSVAVLGLALIAMGEDVGSSMLHRMLGHLLRYGEPVIKRAVPLALALISVSNPQMSILEMLSKMSHDQDQETAHAAIFALGLVGAGSNNARLAAMLRQLAVYHHREPTSLLMVRIAQGLAHMGKGTMTLSPYHSDRQLMCPVSVAALLTVCFAFLDSKSTICGPRQHYLLYCLVPAIQPRLLLTFEYDEEDETDPMHQVPVAVRVGQAVDIVGQAGKPKTITGFQTHTTPVLLAYNERAELVDDTYIPMSPVLEGLVILKKNPDVEESKKK